MHKEIAREEGQIQSSLAIIGPVVYDVIQGQEMLNLPLGVIAGHPLFVIGLGKHRIPGLRQVADEQRIVYDWRDCFSQLGSHCTQGLWTRFPKCGRSFALPV